MSTASALRLVARQAPRLKGCAFKVFTAISDAYDEHGRDVELSYVDIARLAGAARSSVALHVKALDEAGLITRFSARGGRTNFYRVPLIQTAGTQSENWTDPVQKMSSTQSENWTAPNKERARVSLTHSYSSVEPMKESVSECAVQIGKALANTFQFHVAPHDPLLAELERLTAEAELELGDLFQWFSDVRQEKQRRNYRITSAGAILDWARQDLAAWSQRRKPMGWATARQEASTSEPAPSPAEEIASLQSFLEYFPTHPDADTSRQRLQNLLNSQTHRYAANGGPV